MIPVHPYDYSDSLASEHGLFTCLEHIMLACDLLSQHDAKK